MIFSWLAALLAVGGLASLLPIPPEAFGRRFHGLMGFMASLLLAVGLAGGALRGVCGWSLLCASALWVCLTPWAPIGWLRPALAAVTAIGLAAILGGTRFPPLLHAMDAAPWAPPANALAAAFLLGSVTMGMLVGHWYLNVPGLDIIHLRRMTWLLAGSLAVRILLGMGSIAMATPTYRAGELSPWRVAGIREAFFFWPRVGIGLVAPAVLVFMIYRTVRIRSTQSATGLLYVAVVLVVMGEMISRFLYLSTGIPQ